MCALTGEFVAPPQAGRRQADCGGMDAKKLDMRVMIRVTAVFLVVFSLGWGGCQSTHSDGSAPATTPATAITPPQEPSAPFPAPVDPNGNTVPQTVLHAQPGMQNMPAAAPAARSAAQPARTLALTGPPRVPARVTRPHRCRRKGAL
jgi:hypothetical protein